MPHARNETPTHPLFSFEFRYCSSPVNIKWKLRGWRPLIACLSLALTAGKYVEYARSMHVHVARILYRRINHPSCSAALMGSCCACDRRYKTGGGNTRVRTTGFPRRQGQNDGCHGDPHSYGPWNIHGEDWHRWNICFRAWWGKEGGGDLLLRNDLPVDARKSPLC